MSAERPRISVRMARPNLDNLPPVEVPDGHSWRGICGDDLAADIDRWLQVAVVAFPETAFTREWFHKEYVEQPQWSPDRLVMVFAGTAPAAVSSAWVLDPAETEVGLIHWVATHPEHTGRHLGKLATLLCLHWLRDHGFRGAILNTDTFRVPALKIYLQLGFQPCYKQGAAEDVWDGIFAETGYAARPNVVIGRWGDADLP